MEHIKNAISFMVILGTALILFLAVVVAVPEVEAQELLPDQSECLMPSTLMQTCGGTYPLSSCPDLDIPKAQYAEVMNYLPIANGCYMRPLSHHHTIKAYRTRWQEAKTGFDQCLNLWAMERVNLMVQAQKLHKACGSKCKKVK